MCLGDPALTTVLVRARDGGSMHRRPYLKATAQLHEFLRYNVSVEFKANEKTELVHYKDFCGHFCDANVVIEYFYVIITKRIIQKTHYNCLGSSEQRSEFF